LEILSFYTKLRRLIEEEQRAGWLGEEPIDAKTLASYSPDNNLLTVWPVNRAVGNIRNNASRSFGTYSLNGHQ